MPAGYGQIRLRRGKDHGPRKNNREAKLARQTYGPVTLRFACGHDETFAHIPVHMPLSSVEQAASVTPCKVCCPRGGDA